MRWRPCRAWSTSASTATPACRSCRFKLGDCSALARAGISYRRRVAHVVETALAGRVVYDVCGRASAWSRCVLCCMLPSQRGSRPMSLHRRSTRALGERGARCSARASSQTSREGRGAPEVDPLREANNRYVALKFNVEGRDLGSVVDEAIAAVDAGACRSPEGQRVVWGGEFENQQRAMARLEVIVLVALLIVFMLLRNAIKCWVCSQRGERSCCRSRSRSPAACSACSSPGSPLSVSAAVGFIALLGQVSLAGLLLIPECDRRRTTLRGRGRDESVIGRRRRHPLPSRCS